MKKDNKLIPTLILLAVVLPPAAAGGLYLGSWLFVSWLSLKASPAIGMLPRYWSYPNLPESMTLPLGVSTAAAAAVTLVLPLMLLVAAVLKPKRELHGSARFANAVEIAKLGLINKKFDPKKDLPDLLVGQYKGQYLRWAGNEFMYLSARTRSGKGVGIVIPNCLHYRHSMVVYDPKLENFLISAGFRAKCGQEVFLFNPGGRLPEHERNPNAPLVSHKRNPFTYIRRNPLYTYKDLSNMAGILLPKSPRDSGSSTFFTESSRKLFVGLALYMIETENERDLEDYRQRSTLTNLFRLTTPTGGKALTEWIKDEVERREQADTPLSDQCRTLLLGFANGNAKTGADILASLTAPLGIFLDPVVEAATSGDDFRLDDVRKKPMTVYIGIVPTEADTFSRLTNLFFSQLIDVNVQQGLPENNPGLFPYQCLLLMDEFTALGPIPAVQHGVSYIAGYGLRLLIIIQAPSQVEAVYGRENMCTFFTNFTLRIFYTPRDQTEAEEYSRIIGNETFKAKSVSRGKSSRSTSTSDQARAVMNPDEIKRMPLEDCVIDVAGSHPVYAQKIVYWKDEVFKPRIHLPLPEVAVLDIKAHPKREVQAPDAEYVPDEELEQTDRQDCANAKDLIISMLAGLLRPGDSKEYREKIASAVAKGWGIADKPTVAKLMAAAQAV